MYDCAQAGVYFVTVCTKDRRCLFGDVAAGAMRLNQFGRIAQTCWQEIGDHFPKT